KSSSRSMNSFPGSSAIRREAPAADDRGQAIEEIYQPIKKMIAQYPPRFYGSKSHQGLHRSAWIRYIHLTIAMSSSRHFVRSSSSGSSGSSPQIAASGVPPYPERPSANGVDMVAKSQPARTNGRLPSR